MNKLKEKAFWIAFGDVAGRGLAFFCSLYLARTLGPEYYGLITVAVSVLGYATWFSDLGLISIGTRETAREPEKRTFRTTEIFRIKIFLGVVVLAASSAIVWFLKIDLLQKHVILGYLFSIIPYVFMMEWYFAGKQEFSKIALSKILNGVVYLLLVILFVNTAGDVKLVPFLYAGGITTAAVVLGVFAIRSKPFPQPSRGIPVYRDLLKTSSLLGTGKFFGQMIQLLPPIAVGAFLSLKDAGYYGAAFKIVVIAMMVDRVFVNLLLPNLSSLWSVDKQTARKHLDTVFRVVTAGGTLIALFIAVSSKSIILTLYSAEYAGSIILLQVLTILIAITFINSLFSFGLIAIGRDQEYFRATLSGGLLSGVIILVFIFFGNTFMAAISVALAELVITLFTWNAFKKFVSLSYARPALICFSTAILLFSISRFLSLPPFINGLMASLVYIVIIHQFRVLKNDQLKWIQDKLRA